MQECGGEGRKADLVVELGSGQSVAQSLGSPGLPSLGGCLVGTSLSGSGSLSSLGSLPGGLGSLVGRHCGVALLELALGFHRLLLSLDGGLLGDLQARPVTMA